jgi:hypothetical protein
MTPIPHPGWCDVDLCTARPTGPPGDRGSHRSRIVELDLRPFRAVGFGQGTGTATLVQKVATWDTEVFLVLGFGDVEVSFRFGEARELVDALDDLIDEADPTLAGTVDHGRCLFCGRKNTLSMRGELGNGVVWECGLCGRWYAAHSRVVTEVIPVRAADVEPGDRLPTPAGKWFLVGEVLDDPGAGHIKFRDRITQQVVAHEWGRDETVRVLRRDPTREWQR